jgi:hypothetical protein
MASQMETHRDEHAGVWHATAWRMVRRVGFVVGVLATLWGRYKTYIDASHRGMPAWFWFELGPAIIIASMLLTIWDLHSQNGRLAARRDEAARLKRTKSILRRFANDGDSQARGASCSDLVTWRDEASGLVNLALGREREGEFRSAGLREASSSHAMRATNGPATDHGPEVFAYVMWLRVMADCLTDADMRGDWDPQPGQWDLPADQFL